MIDPDLIASICHTFERGKSVRRYLSSGSKLVIDQKMPYICVYRYIDKPEPYISSLLKTQGAYLIANAELELGTLLRCLIEVAIKDFKSYLIVEIWNNPESANRKNIEIWHPGEKITATIMSLQKGFSEFNILMPGIGTTLISSNQRQPEFFNPLLPLDELKKTGTLSIGLAIPLFFRDAETKQGYPIFFRKIRKKFAQIIQ